MRALLTICLCFFASVSLAEEAPVGQNLDIELNAASQTNDGCQLSFVLINGHTEDIQQAVFETVLFDTSGAVIRLTLFDMGELPAARPRVRQFVLPQTQCSDMGQILFNGTTSCTADTLANTACMDGLSLRSRTDIKVLG
jgi:hypothetical protein